MYSVRDAIKDKKTLFKALEKVKAAGYDGVEFAGYFGASAEEIKALAALPPNSILMKQRPRNSNASIITSTMMKFILTSGAIFAVLMIGLYYYFVREANGGPVFARGINPNINAHEMGMYFSVFVFLQFWNMLNARSFATGKWAFNNLEDSKVFWMVATVIFVGQIVLVQYFSPMFDCAPLTVVEWLWVILGTMPVFLIGQLFVTRVKNA